MKNFIGDLHIHSCLSPCADLGMSPLTIVRESLQKGLHFIAVCDHNSAENAGAAARAGAKLGLHVLPGMEINSREEIHSLAIFDKEEQALSMQEMVYRHLPGKNNPGVFGEQVVANEIDEVDGFNERMLIGATQLSIETIVAEVHRLGGISIACHVDRPSYSILSQLGFIPPGLELDAAELTFRAGVETLDGYMEALKGLPVIRSSDAHMPEDIGRGSTSFFIESPCVEEIRLALRAESGRRVEIN
jgi:3',5'-nucleoside bisphosphate phosphatase